MLSTDGGDATLPTSGPWRADDRTMIAGRYRLIEQVGRGGMGAVYRAFDRELDDTVALKVLFQTTTPTPAVLDAFRSEVKLARKVTHPNVARTFDIGEHDGVRFVTLEFIDGVTLRDRLPIGASKPLPQSEVVTIVTAVCLGLEAAHAVGVVHRDLKPENILLGKDGRIAIVDFGIAGGDVADDSAPRPAHVLGTPMYLSPEQAEGKHTDQRTDLYSLGALLFEMVTGRQPFSGASLLEVVTARLNGPPPDPSEYIEGLAPALRNLVVHLMQREPSLRPSSARAVLEALADLDSAAVSTRSVRSPRVARSGSLPTATRDVSTVAVLPLAYRGPAEEDYLADGLSEDLVDQLAMGGSLRVRPYGSVLRFAQRQTGVAPDPAVVGRELGVDIVVEGSIQRIGSQQLRVAVRVTNVSDGFQIWAQRFEVPASELLRLSDQIAQAIVTATTGEEPQRPARAASDSGAIELYLRARHALVRFELNALDQSIQLADEALRLAPDDPAFVVLGARLHTRAWFNGSAASAARADQLSRRALELAPDQAEPHFAMAIVEVQRNNIGSAFRHLALALRKNRMLAEAHALVGRLLAELGDVARAQQYLETSYRLEPSDMFLLGDLARIKLLLGDREEGLRLLDRCADLPGHTMWAQIARLLSWTGDVERAQRWRARPELDQPANLLARVVFDRMISGDLAQDPRRLFNAEGKAAAASARGRVFAYQIIAEVQAGNGDLDAAMRTLEDAVASGLIDVLWIEGCPYFAPLRARPRHAELARVVRSRADGLLALSREL